MWKSTCGERLVHSANRAQSNTAAVSCGVVGYEVPQSGKRKQMLDAIQDLDIYPW